MSDIDVTPDTLRQYGDIMTQVASSVAAAGAVDQATTVAATVSVFGLIGQEFLAAFAFAQANHFASFGTLVQSYSGTSAVAYTSAKAYEDNENNSAKAFPGRPLVAAGK